MLCLNPDHSVSLASYAENKNQKDADAMREILLTGQNSPQRETPASRVQVSFLLAEIPDGVIDCRDSQDLKEFAKGATYAELAAKHTISKQEICFRLTVSGHKLRIAYADRELSQGKCFITCRAKLDLLRSERSRTDAKILELQQIIRELEVRPIWPESPSEAETK